MSISGKKVNLRPVEFSDLSKIKSWRNDPSLMKYFREYRFFLDTQAEQWYKKMIKTPDFPLKFDDLNLGLGIEFDLLILQIYQSFF